MKPDKLQGRCHHSGPPAFVKYNSWLEERRAPVGRPLPRRGGHAPFDAPGTEKGQPEDIERTVDVATSQLQHMSELIGR